MAVALAWALAAMTLAGVILIWAVGAPASAAGLLILLLYVGAAVLLRRGAASGRFFAVAAAVPAICFGVFGLLTGAFAWASAEGGPRPPGSSVVWLLLGTTAGAALNSLLIHDAFASPPAPSAHRPRLSRLREVPSWTTLLGQFALGLGFFLFAVLGGREVWRYGKVSSALVGVSVMIFATARAVARGIDAAYGRWISRVATKVDES